MSRTLMARWRLFVMAFSSVLLLDGALALAAPAPRFLSYREFSALSVSDQTMYVEALQKFVGSWSKDPRSFAEAHRIDRGPFVMLFLPEASATPGGICLYAGFISKFNERDKCARPQEAMSRTWKIAKPDGGLSEQKLCSGSGQTLCNPMIYGFGKPDSSGGYSGLCVTQVATATSDCEKKYQELPNYKASHIAAQLAASGIAKDFDGMSKQMSEYCAGEGATRQKENCDLMKRRTSFLRDRVAKAAKTPADKLTKALPAASTDDQLVLASAAGAVVPDGTTANAEQVQGGETAPGAKIPVPKARPKNPTNAEDCPPEADQSGSTKEARALAANLDDVKAKICKPDPATKPQPEASEPVVKKTNSGWNLKFSNVMNDMMEAGQKKLTESQGRTDGCVAGCKRKNSASLSVDTVPSGMKSNKECPATPEAIKLSAAELSSADPGTALSGSTLVRRFQGRAGSCDDKLQDWMQGGLSGDTRLGKALGQKCKSPCSYSNSMEITKINGSGCDFNVRWVVKCGPPKAAMEWTTAIAVKNPWTCEPGDAK